MKSKETEPYLSNTLIFFPKPVLPRDSVKEKIQSTVWGKGGGTGTREERDKTGTNNNSILKKKIMKIIIRRNNTEHIYMTIKMR